MKTEESENAEENVKITEMRKTSKLQKCGLRKTRKKRKRKNVAKQLQKKGRKRKFCGKLRNCRNCGKKLYASARIFKVEA